MPPRKPSARPGPVNETPFWRTRSFVWLMVMVAALAGAGGTAALVKLNHRQQMQWRLEQDAALSRLRQSLTKQIAAAKPGTPRAPVALWLGRVRKFTIGQQTAGNSPISLLDLSGAVLLAGTRGAKDGTDSLTISGKNHIWGGPHPKSGEIWMIAVWRDGDNNAIHTAVRTSLK